MKLFKITLFLLIYLSISLKANSINNLQGIFNEGVKLIFIRHAYAPGGGDPKGFDLLNCSTQRNLNNEGILQSKRIKQFFLEKDIMIDKVFSSEWCRCKQTAEYAFGKYETKSFLNSFFSEKFAHNKDDQIKELNDYIKNYKKNGNLIFITHYVVIFELLNIHPASGEIIIANKNLTIISRIETNN